MRARPIDVPPPAMLPMCGEKETCYEQLVECLLGSGCPVTLPPAQ